MLLVMLLLFYAVSVGIVYEPQFWGIFEEIDMCGGLPQIAGDFDFASFARVSNELIKHDSVC